MAGGLLAIDVLAGGAAEDRGGGMTVVRRGANENLDVLVVQGAAEVGDPFGFVFLPPAERLLHALDDALIHVGNVADLGVRLSQVRNGELAAAAIGPHEDGGNAAIGRATLLRRSLGD